MLTGRNDPSLEVDLIVYIEVHLLILFFWHALCTMYTLHDIVYIEVHLLIFSGKHFLHDIIFFMTRKTGFCSGRSRGADAEDPRSGQRWGGDFGQVAELPKYNII